MLRQGDTGVVNADNVISVFADGPSAQDLDDGS